MSNVGQGIQQWEYQLLIIPSMFNPNDTKRSWNRVQLEERRKVGKGVVASREIKKSKGNK
jgi:hypothetical protein